jgi:hypothetical protein
VSNECPISPCQKSFHRFSDAMSSGRFSIDAGVPERSLDQTPRVDGAVQRRCSTIIG